MSTFNVEQRKKNSIAFPCFIVAILIALLLVGSGVEIGYYRELTGTLDGIEHERDELRLSNNRLRENVINKLDEQSEILKKQGETLNELKKELHKAK